MKRFIKKYFIPHEANEYRPYVLRKDGIRFIFFLVLGIEIFFLTQIFVIMPHTNWSALVMPTVLINETNATRVSHDVAPLAVDQTLEVAAADKANDMATKGYFSHTSPDGLSPWYWFRKVGYSFAYAGENLAIDFADSKDVIDAWLQSPAHRANMLNSDFTEIGIATARGMYKGREVVFIVQLFGTPLAEYSPQENSLIKTALAPKLVALPPMPTPEFPASTTENNFIAVKGAEASLNLATGSVTETKAKPTLLWTGAAFLTSPRETTNELFYLLGTLLVTALALNIFIKIHIQHRDLITNGLVMILFVIGVILINQYLPLGQHIV